MLQKMFRIVDEPLKSNKLFINLASKPSKMIVTTTKTTTEKPLKSIIKENKTETSIINVFTDGSCIQTVKNKENRPAGYACVFPEYPKYNYAAKLEGKEKTNNRAEYMACIVALQIADKIDPKHEKHIKVFTDSELMINSLTKWLPSWKQKNWKKADGSPVKNIDLLKILDQLMQKRTITFKHVKAHTGKTDWESKHNDIVDKMARTAALSK